MSLNPDINLDRYTVKDSGARQNLAGGMVRDIEEGKTDYTLVLDGPMFERYAVHLTKGAKKYSARNWMKSARGTREEIEATMERFKRSAFRHFIQWFDGNDDEDHGAAVLFNINGYEYLAAELLSRDNDTSFPPIQTIENARDHFYPPFAGSTFHPETPHESSRITAFKEENKDA